MRLRNIYVLCTRNLEKIEAINGADVSGNASYTFVSGWHTFLECYEELKAVDYLRDEVIKLFMSVPEIYRHQAQFKVTNAEWATIRQNKVALISGMSDAIKLYESMNLNSDEQMGMDVKLPKCEDFADFKKYIDDLEFILYKCPFFRIEGEELRFETFDVGSMWLNFVIGGLSVGAASMILNNIAAFIDKCYVVKSHKLTLKQQELQLQAMEMDEKEREIVLNGIKKIYRQQVEDVISQLEEASNVELKDGEERGVVLQALEKANNLIDKGLQIYSTIDSPKEVKALFEPIEMKYLALSNDIKQLEEK